LSNGLSLEKTEQLAPSNWLGSTNSVTRINGLNVVGFDTTPATRQSLTAFELMHSAPCATLQEAFHY